MPHSIDSAELSPFEAVSALDHIAASPEIWREASADFVRRLDTELRKRYRGGVLPWERSVGVGEIDFFKVHSYALAALDWLLAVVLPDGDELPDATWRGRHDQDAPWAIVSLLSGTWSEPASGARGDDLVALIAHVYSMSQPAAAVTLACHLGIEAIRRV